MRKLFFVILVTLFLLQPAAFAKNVIFVTSQQLITEQCADLAAASTDRLFCDEIQKLGNNVIVKTENAVLTNAWESDVSTADLIFLGNVSAKMYNLNDASSIPPPAFIFCNNVFTASDGSARNIPVISSSINDYKNLTFQSSSSAGTGKTTTTTSGATAGTINWPSGGPTGGATAGSGVGGDGLLGCGAYRLVRLLPSYGFNVTPNDNICETGTFKKQLDGYITHGMPKIIPLYTKTYAAYVANKTLLSAPEVDTWIVDECTPRKKNPTSWYGQYPTILTFQDFMFFGPSAANFFSPTGWLVFDRSVLYMLNDYSLNISYITIPQYPAADGKMLVYVSAPKNTTVSITANGITKTAKYANATGFYEAGEISLGSADKFYIYSETNGGLRFSNTTVSPGANFVKVNSLSAVRKGTYLATIRATVDNPANIGSASYKIWAKNLTLLASGDLSYREGSYQADATASDSNVTIEVDFADSDSKVGGAYKNILLDFKPTAGTDFTLSPDNWLLSYAQPKTVFQNFTISAAKMNLTDIKIIKSGTAGDAISLDLAGMKLSLKPGESTLFKASIDLSKVGARATGKIIISSNEVVAEIPVDAIVDKAISGSKWLSINPKSWTSIIPQGNAQAKTFNLTSLGPYHANEISFDATGNFSTLLSYDKIQYIKAGMDAPVKLNLNTKSLAPGQYAGKINVYSSIGNDSLDVSIEIVKDFSDEISMLRDNITETETLINQFANKSVDVSDAQQKLLAAKSALEDVDAKWSAQNYAGAKASLPDARAKLDEAYAAAKDLKEPLPILLIAAAIILLMAALLAYKFKDKIMEKLGKKKKAEIPEEDQPAGEERYTPPEEQGSGYRTEYY